MSSFWTSVVLAAAQGRAGSICWNLAINCLGGDGEWVELARGWTFLILLWVTHLVLLPGGSCWPLDSWQCCVLPAGRPCKSYLRQLDEATGVRSPPGPFSSSTETPYLLSETGSVAPDL